jgi:hypothetical protein
MIKLPESNGQNPEFYRNYCVFFIIYHYSRDEILEALGSLIIEATYLESIKKNDIRFLAECLITLLKQD